MSLLSFIAALLRPQQKRKASHRESAAVAPFHHESTTPEQVKQPQRPVQNTDATANKPKPQSVQVTVQYVDQATNHALREPDRITGFIGDALSLNWRHFPGRLFTRIENYTDTFTEDQDIITLYYQEVLAAPVSVYHRGSAGRLLAPPELIYGAVDMAFTVSALPEHAADVIGESSQQGVFSTTAQTIHFNYKETGIEHGSLPEAAYVEVLVNKQVFAKARSASALSAYLPEETVWQVFGLVREEVTHQVWLNLGGSQWITATHTRPHKQNPYLPAPAKLDPPQLGFKVASTTELAVTGIVDGPSTGAHIWDTPYGTILNATLTNGVHVTVAARVNVSDGSTWYRLNTNHYIQAMYLHLPEIK